MLRELGAADAPPVYGRPLTMAMARSKLDEHKLRDVELIDLDDGEDVDLGPFTLELIHMTHSIPDASAVALTSELGTILVTGDYKFDQTPVDGEAADMSRLAQLGAEGILLLCGDSTNADRPGFSPSESVVGPHLEEVFARARGPRDRDELRLEHPPRPAGHRRRRRARAQGRAGRALDAQERRHRAASSATSRSPTGLIVTPREIDDFPDHRMVIISTGSQGEPLSALRRMAYRDHPQVKLHDGDTVVFSATPIPGNERAVNETIDRLYHIGCEVITTARRADPRLRARLRRGAQADAEPDQAALRDAVPRRLQADPPARRARRGRRDRHARRSSAPRTATCSSSTRAAPASASPSAPG